MSLVIPIRLPNNGSFDFYIAPGGNDANPGTLQAPWALTSFVAGSANNNKMGGKRIGIIAGSYSLTGLPQQSGSFSYNILTLPAGTSAKSTYVASCDASGNYSARAATITHVGGVSSNGMMGNVQGDNSQYVTIDGIRFNGNFTNANGLNGGGHCLQFYSTSYSRSSSLPATLNGIVVKNCELYNVTGNFNGGNYGTTIFAGCIGAIFQNNLVHDVVLGANDDPSHSGGVLEIGCQNSQYLNNTIYNCPAGIWVKEGSTGTLAAYNYMYNVAATSQDATGFCAAFMNWDGQAGDPNPGPSPTTQTIHHNVIDGCGALHIPNLNQPVATDIAIVAYNNTVYDTKTAGGNGWLHTANGCVNQFYNNIYVTTAGSSGVSGGQPGKLCLTPGQFSSTDFNCYFSVTGSYTEFWAFGNSSNYNSFAAWQAAAAASVSGSEAHSINASPGFSLPGGYVAGGGSAQFQLAGGSPCLGTGLAGVNMGAWDGSSARIGCDHDGLVNQ